MKKIVLPLMLLAPILQAKFNACEFRLKNGLQVICVEKKSSPIVLFSIWYRCGSKCDAVSKTGVAHYLEHMAIASDKLSRDFLEGMGAEHNAFTSINLICFYEIVPLKALDRIFEYEAKRMELPSINDEEFVGEKGAILEERNQRVDNDPDGAQREVLLSNIFNREIGGSALIGWKHEIESIQKQDLYEFHQKWFAPNNAILVIVGDCSPDDVKTLAEKHFAIKKMKKMPEEKTENREFSGLKEIVCSSPKRGLFSSVEYIYNVPFSSKKNFRKSLALDMGLKILNQPAFFLKKTLKHVLNIANDVAFSYTKGIFQCDIVSVSISSSSPENLADSIKTWKYLKNKLLTLGVSTGELEVVKRKEKLAQAYQRNNIEYVANYFGWLAVCGYSLKDIQTSDEIIDSITAAECNQALREVFSSIQIAEQQAIPKGYDRD
ncbi:MAG: insulinase family protein [Holosporaceae bacterium]|nr:insulinase family protein [Holosporaceae bacterium]